jgi:hypothetical protein
MNERNNATNRMSIGRIERTYEGMRRESEEMREANERSK